MERINYNFATCEKLIVIFRSHRYNQNAVVFTNVSENFVKQFLLKMLSLKHNKKHICENCGTETTRINLARHTKGCSVGTLYCSQCPIFSKRSQAGLNFHNEVSIAHRS